MYQDPHDSWTTDPLSKWVQPMPTLRQAGMGRLCAACLCVFGAIVAFYAREVISTTNVGTLVLTVAKWILLTVGAALSAMELRLGVMELRRSWKERR